MPDITPRVGLKKPLDNEYVTREAYLENIDITDASFAILGNTNQAINKVKAVSLKVDTRTIIPTYSSGLITGTVEKDGATTVKTSTVNYDGSGNITSVVKTAGGTTVTTTLTYTNSLLTGVSKEVV